MLNAHGLYGNPAPWQTSMGVHMEIITIRQQAAVCVTIYGEERKEKTGDTFHFSAVKTSWKFRTRYDFRLLARVRSARSQRHSEPLRIRRLYTTLKVYSCMKYNVFNCLLFFVPPHFPPNLTVGANTLAIWKGIKHRKPNVFPSQTINAFPLQPRECFLLL